MVMGEDTMALPNPFDPGHASMGGGKGDSDMPPGGLDGEFGDVWAAFELRVTVDESFEKIVMSICLRAPEGVMVVCSCKAEECCICKRDRCSSCIFLREGDVSSRTVLAT
jgi:hypothetical protein